MIQIIKKKIIMKEELLYKINWACMMSKVTPKIYEGNLRIIDRTNLAYVEPHRVIIKEKIYLFFNDIDGERFFKLIQLVSDDKSFPNNNKNIVGVLTLKDKKEENKVKK